MPNPNKGCVPVEQEFVRDPGAGFIAVADLTTVILRHVQTTQFLKIYFYIFNRFVDFMTDLQISRIYDSATAMNPGPDGYYIEFCNCQTAEAELKGSY